ncbi:hypothetical protein JS528_01215 [Bifidobacterium sp. MA2]|uniref:DNA-binding response regulator n=1 Tax=Bifidobacterium santillanense TaxID=2809028 RepID=A0ABS5UMI7_9BIFI|nr:hypothetical protein [Bifidobacterium santillanense]MBT1172000.1 hypothetical protein [Bifidobacterium santillanense]
MTDIVVVEDEKELNDIMCLYLRDAGYTVSGCLDVRRAYPTDWCCGRSWCS